MRRAHAQLQAQRSRRSPAFDGLWYVQTMSDTFTATMGDRGRVVVPADVRQRCGFEKGQRLVFVDTADGVILMTMKRLEERVRADFASGPDLVSELIAERRQAARAENSQ